MPIPFIAMAGASLLGSGVSAFGAARQNRNNLRAQERRQRELDGAASRNQNQIGQLFGSLQNTLGALGPVQGQQASSNAFSFDPLQAAQASVQGFDATTAGMPDQIASQSLDMDALFGTDAFSGMTGPGFNPQTGMPGPGFNPQTGMTGPRFIPQTGMTGPGFNPQTGMPGPGFNPQTGMPGPRFNPQTGMPGPRFIPQTGFNAQTGSSSFMPSGQTFNAGQDALMQFLRADPSGRMQGSNDVLQEIAATGLPSDLSSIFAQATNVNRDNNAELLAMATGTGAGLGQRFGSATQRIAGDTARRLGNEQSLQNSQLALQAGEAAAGRRLGAASQLGQFQLQGTGQLLDAASTLQQGGIQQQQLAQQDRQFGAQDAQFFAELGQADRQFGFQAGQQDRQFGFQAGQQDAQFFSQLDQQDRQFGFQAGQQDRQLFSQLDQADRQFGFQAGQQDRQLFSQLDQADRQFGFQAGQQEAQFFSQLGQADRQFGFQAGQQDAQLFSQLDQQDRQFGFQAGQQDRQLFSQLGQADRQFGFQAGQQDRQFVQGQQQQFTQERGRMLLQAALANQQNAFQTGSFNANLGQQGAQFNAAAINNARQFNADAANQTGRFNAGAMNTAAQNNIAFGLQANQNNNQFGLQATRQNNDQQLNERQALLTQLGLGGQFAGQQSNALNQILGIRAGQGAPQATGQNMAGAVGGGFQDLATIMQYFNRFGGGNQPSVVGPAIQPMSPISMGR